MMIRKKFLTRFLALTFFVLAATGVVYADCTKKAGESATAENINDLTKCVMQGGRKNPNFLKALIGSQMCTEAFENYERNVYATDRFKLDGVAGMGDKSTQMVTACCLYAKRAVHMNIEGYTTREKTAAEKKKDEEITKERLEAVEERLKGKETITLDMALAALKTLGGRDRKSRADMIY